MKSPELVSATHAELDEILALAKAAAFPQQQYELLERVLATFAYVMLAQQNAKMTLKRFRIMLLGKQSESRAALCKELACRPTGLAAFLGKVSGITFLQKKIHQYQDARKIRNHLEQRDRLKA